MSDQAEFRWRFIFGLTIGIGVIVGLVIVFLDSVFGVSFPPILGGVLSAVLIVVVLALRKPPSKSE